MKINVINVGNQDIWHAIVLGLDVLTVIIMAMLWQIAQTKSHHLAHQQGTGKGLPNTQCHDRSLYQSNQQDRHHHYDSSYRSNHKILTIVIIGTGVGTAGQDPTPTATDIGVTVTMTQEEAILGLTTTPHAAVHLTTEAPTHIATDETPHTVDPHPLEASPETTADQGQAHYTNATTEHQQDPLTASDG